MRHGLLAATFSVALSAMISGFPAVAGGDWGRARKLPAQRLGGNCVHRPRPRPGLGPVPDGRRQVARRRPIDGQPIPGLLRCDSGAVAGRLTLGLPDNGFGAQTNSADFVIGFYDVTPRLQDRWATAPRRAGRSTVHGFTPFSDPQRAARRVLHHGRSGLQRASTTIRTGVADSGRSRDHGRPAG